MSQPAQPLEARSFEARSFEAQSLDDGPEGTTEERPVGPRSRKGERTRARLLAAAKQVFEQQGYLDARISDIAEAAGMSHGSFYHYFDSKEQIFRELVAAVDEKLGAPMVDVILAPSPNPPADRLREALRRHFASYADEARIMGLIEQVSRYDDHVAAVLRARHTTYTQQVAESIRQLQKRKRADPELDPTIVAEAIGALTDRFAELWLVQGTIDCTLDEAVEQVTKMIVNVLRLEH